MRISNKSSVKPFDAFFKKHVKRAPAGYFEQSYSECLVPNKEDPVRTQAKSALWRIILMHDLKNNVLEASALFDTSVPTMTRILNKDFDGISTNRIMKMLECTYVRPEISVEFLVDEDRHKQKLASVAQLADAKRSARNQRDRQRRLEKKLTAANGQ